MHQILKAQLHSYLCSYYPEMIKELESTFAVQSYLDEKLSSIQPLLKKLLRAEKPDHVIRELCLKEMTDELGPSKFLIIRNLLEEEFTGDYLLMRENGSLSYETVNLIQSCQSIFKLYNFRDDMKENQLMRYALIEHIHSYLLRTK